MFKVGDLVKHQEAYNSEEVVTTARGKIKELFKNGEARVEFYYDALEDEFTDWEHVVDLADLSIDQDGGA